jgi:hypothetical protein
MLRVNPGIPVPKDINMNDFINRNSFQAEFPKLSNFVDRSELPFCPLVSLNNSGDWERMLNEVKALCDNFVLHRKHDYHVGWESLVLHGLSSVHTGSYAGYGLDEKKLHYNRWTDISDFMPTIKNYVLSLGFTNLRRVRVMKLASKGYIKVHHDDAYGIGAVNIAINNPDNCNFYMDNFGILPFYTSSKNNLPRVIMPNTGYYHCVVNNSNEDRYHIIIHGDHPKEWEDLKYAALS